MRKNTSTSSLLLVLVVALCATVTTPQSASSGRGGGGGGTRAKSSNVLFPLVATGNVNNIVDIDEQQQEIMIMQAEIECVQKISASKNQESLLKKKYPNAIICPMFWDKIMCWDEALVNTTSTQRCPTYINKFNINQNATKNCVFRNSTFGNWSSTRFQACQTADVQDVPAPEFENHMRKIIYIRICGYIVSMVALTLSIMVLLRKPMRCPRNNVHVNLFLAFALRTILVILTNSIIGDNLQQQHPHAAAVAVSAAASLDEVPTTTTTTTMASTTSAADLLLSVPSHFSNDSSAMGRSLVHKVVERQHNVGCKVMYTFFRYSGSVYHTAIFAEALYLFLLLKCPYFQEKNGSKLCIVISWLLPLLWIVPWLIVRILSNQAEKYDIHDTLVKNCWQAESTYNLIIKVPHSMLLVCNIVSAAYIIRILYSKMTKARITQEKILKYRRLAKSILILIPIFGLHFMLFAWAPYVHLVRFSSLFEIVILYTENFFNAFQGLVVSIASCFIHAETRVELLDIMLVPLRKLKFLNKIPCMARILDTNFIQQWKNKLKSGALSTSVKQKHEQTMVSQVNQTEMVEPHGAPKSHFFRGGVDENRSLLPQTSTTATEQQQQHQQPRSMSLTSASELPRCFGACCVCLMDTEAKNDFYQAPSRSSKSRKKGGRLFRGGGGSWSNTGGKKHSRDASQIQLPKKQSVASTAFELKGLDSHESEQQHDGDDRKIGFFLDATKAADGHQDKR